MGRVEGHLPVLLQKVQLPVFEELLFRSHGLQLDETEKVWFSGDGKELRGSIESGDNLLQSDGQVSRFAYNNIAAIALRIGETDWAEQFIHQYKNSLEREYRHVTFSLNKVRLEFARKNYREALLNLQFSDYKDLINSMNAKVLQLKIYYLTGEHEALESHLTSMKTYVRRQRSFGYHKEIYLNIIRFTQALLTINPFDKKSRSTLREKIESAEWLTEREWLLEMVDR